MVQQWLTARAAVLVDRNAELVTPLGRELAEQGLNVVLAVSERAARTAVERAVSEVCATGAQALVVRGELSSPGAPQRLFDEAIDSFGAVAAGVVATGTEPAGLQAAVDVLVEACTRVEDGGAVICLVSADDQLARLGPVLRALQERSASRGVAFVGLVARCTSGSVSGTASEGGAELAGLVGRIVSEPGRWQGIVSDLDAWPAV